MRPWPTFMLTFMSLNVLPQVGMSALPWAVTVCSPLRMAKILDVGEFPVVPAADLSQVGWAVA